MDPVMNPVQRAGGEPAGDVVFESTFTMDEHLLKELVSAKDRSLNKRDGLVMSVVWAVVLACYVWGTVSVWSFTPLGAVLGALIVALLAWSVALAATGFTLFWPKRSWRKTRAHWFARHGVATGQAERCTLRTEATPFEARCSVMDGTRAAGTIAKAYRTFSHVERTEHLVVLVAGEAEVGSVLHNMFSPSYADRLEARADLEDMAWATDSLTGGTADELVAYLERKVGARA